MPFLNLKLEIDFSDYIADRTLNFTGREWVFEAIQNWLTDPKAARFFLLTGKPGSGKTAIAARLAQFAQRKEDCPEIKNYPGIDAGFLHGVFFCSARKSTWTSPLEFSRTLALQLAQSIPEFALALKDIGEETVDIDANVTVEIAESSTIQAVVVNNLHIQGLSGQDAFNQVVVNPLQQIRGEGFNQFVTILVDSLDEALTHDKDIQNTIVNLLSKLPSDTRLRLILTSRNEDKVKEKFYDIDYKELFLSSPENLEKNQQDIRKYINGHFKREKKLLNSLQAESFDQENITSQLIEKSEGNFLYIRFLLDSVILGQQNLKNLDGLPQGLEALYYDSLERVVDLGKKEWSEVYAPVMGVLVAAQESLTLSQIQAFTGINKQDLWYYLCDLRQFLDEEEKGEETQYKLYHQSVTDFLDQREFVTRKNKLNNRYYLPREVQHQRLVEYYLPKNQLWNEVQLEKIDFYGRQHLAQHLVKANQVEKLHALLSREEPGNQNAWFLAKENHGETASYIEDVRLAWEQVYQNFEKNPSQVIGLLCRYALINASISSKANMSPDLIVALVEHGEWKLEQGFAYARQIPNLDKKVIALEELFNLPDSIKNYPDTFTKIQNELNRLRLLTKDLPHEKLNQIFPDSPHPLTPTVWQEALKEILEIPEQRRQIQKLNKLIQRVFNSQPPQKIPDDVLGTILDIVLNSGLERYQALILTKLAPYLQADSGHKKILRIARSISNKQRKARLLAILIKKNPNLSESLKREMLREARNAILLIKEDEWHLIELRIKLVSQLCSGQRPRLREIAESKIRSILHTNWSFQDNKVCALIELAPYIVDFLNLQEEIYNVSLFIQNNLDKVKVLTALIPYLTNILKDGACNEILKIQASIDEDEKEILIQILTQLLPHLPNRFKPKFLDYILKYISRSNNKAWKNKDWQIKEELKSLTAYLQSSYRWQATRIVMRMASSRAKVEALAELSSIFPDPIKKEKILKKALEVYRLFSEPTQHSYQELASDIVHREFPSFPTESDIFLTNSPLTKVPKSQEQEVDPLAKVGALTELAKHCSNPLRQEVLEIILKTIEETHDERLQIEMLMDLVTGTQDFPEFQIQQKLKEQVLAIALKIKSKIENNIDYIVAFTKLVIHFLDFQTQEVIDKILQTTSDIKDDTETQINVLNQIALSSIKFAHQAVWEQIKKIFTELKYQEELQVKVDVLITVFPQLAKEDKLSNWYDACKFALSIPDERIREETLFRLVQVLIEVLDFFEPKLLKDLLKLLWDEIFNIKADDSKGWLRNRQDLLININALSPTLHIFVEINSIPEILNAVEDVQRWWP